MTNTFEGNLALICPDCGTHLVNTAPSSERYQCHDCDLHLSRTGEVFALTRFGETVGQMPVDDVAVHMTWRSHSVAPAAALALAV